MQALIRQPSGRTTRARAGEAAWLAHSAGLPAILANHWQFSSVCCNFLWKGVTPVPKDDSVTFDSVTLQFSDGFLLRIPKEDSVTFDNFLLQFSDRVFAPLPKEDSVTQSLRRLTTTLKLQSRTRGRNVQPHKSRVDGRYSFSPLLLTLLESGAYRVDPTRQCSVRTWP